MRRRKRPGQITSVTVKWNEASEYTRWRLRKDKGMAWNTYVFGTVAVTISRRVYVHHSEPDTVSDNAQHLTHERNINP